MTPRLTRTAQRMVILSTAMGVLALLIAFSFDDGRMGFVFILGGLMGVICAWIVNWFLVRDGWFRP